MASGDMSEWVILPRDTVDAWPDTASDSCNPTSACGGSGSCNNCEMPLIATSQGDLSVKQYMRPGAQEDPWISAGHHPDQIVYGENGDANSWHIGAGDALTMGGANVWVNAVGEVETTELADPCDGLDVPAGDTVCESISGDWHGTIDLSGYNEDSVCTIGAATRGDNCKGYCAAMGRPCAYAQDNVGACGVGHDHTRQSTEENGCLQNWQGQICACGLPDPGKISCDDITADFAPFSCTDGNLVNTGLWSDHPGYKWLSGPSDIMVSLGA